VHAEREKPPRPIGEAVVAAVVIVGLAIGVFAALAPSWGTGAAAASGVGAVIALLAVYSVGRYALEKRLWARMVRVLKRLDLGEIDAARRVLTRQVNASQASRAGAACLYLALVEWSAGKPTRAMSLVERAIALLERMREARRFAALEGLGALLLEQARQQRAVLLTAAGRDDEASAEMEPLDPQDTRSTRFAMAVLAAARDGRFEQAARLVDGCPNNKPHAARLVVLGNVANACGEACSEPERALVEAELAELPHLARWLEGATPRLWHAYVAMRDGWGTEGESQLRRRVS
jgi:hypothetical protein